MVWDQPDERYLADVTCLAEDAGWHWAFFAFRDWHAMDYEFGPASLPRGYWVAMERGTPMTLARVPNPIFDVIQEGLCGHLRESSC